MEENKLQKFKGIISDKAAYSKDYKESQIKLAEVEKNRRQKTPEELRLEMDEILKGILTARAWESRIKDDPCRHAKLFRR
jgi:hypothetical protein